MYDPDNCDHNGNFTCETSLDNVVDIYYFDAADTFSCIDQVSIFVPMIFKTGNSKFFVVNQNLNSIMVLFNLVSEL